MPSNFSASNNAGTNEYLFYIFLVMKAIMFSHVMWEMQDPSVQLTFSKIMVI